MNVFSEEFERVLQPIILVLLDIPPMVPVLEGVVMELQDCALPLLRGESASSVCVVGECITVMTHESQHRPSSLPEEGSRHVVIDALMTPVLC